jgi:hypothetical protein
MIMHLRHVHTLSGLSFLNPENFEHWQVTKLLASPRVEFSSVSSVCVCPPYRVDVQAEVS